MSIKINLSYTYEWELEEVMKLLKPILSTGCGFRLMDGSEYSHCYIPRKGGLNLETRKNQ